MLLSADFSFVFQQTQAFNYVSLLLHLISVYSFVVFLNVLILPFLYFYICSINT
jgi:hypothetical protein